MKFVGAHVSAKGGVFNSPMNAVNIGAKAFALFLKNQRQWNSKPYDEKTIRLFKENLQKSNIKEEFVLPHDSYLINLGNPDIKKREKSLNAFIDEVKRSEELGLKMLNFHPGSHLNLIGEEECLELICQSINNTLLNTDNITLVVENTAGQGSNLGYKLEHLAYIISNTNDKNRVGVCLDTCHFFVSGYDIRTLKEYKESMEKFDKIVGFKYLKAMHINDSKPNLGDRVDRHDSIGKGKLGIEPFRFIMNDSRLDNIPLILETIDSSVWKEEIRLLYSLVR